jgi:hypothetical protein
MGIWGKQEEIEAKWRTVGTVVLLSLILLVNGRYRIA